MVTENKDVSEKDLPENIVSPGINESPPIVQQYIISEGATKTGWKWNKYWLFFFIIIVPVIVGIKLRLALPLLFNGDFVLTSGPVSEHVYKIFTEYDVDKDGYLTPYEFQTAFYAVKAGSVSESVNLTEVERESVSLIR